MGRHTILALSISLTKTTSYANKEYHFRHRQASAHTDQSIADAGIGGLDSADVPQHLFGRAI